MLSLLTHIQGPFNPTKHSEFLVSSEAINYSRFFLRGLYCNSIIMSARPSCGVHWDAFTTGSAILLIACTNGLYRRGYRTICGLANIPSEGNKCHPLPCSLFTPGCTGASHGPWLASASVSESTAADSTAVWSPHSSASRGSVSLLSCYSSKSYMVTN